MSSPKLTRRALLAAGAGAVATHALAPAAALAQLGSPPAPVLSDRPIGRLDGVARSIALTGNADLVGLQWQGHRSAHVQLRFRAPGGRWSPWASVGASGHEPDGAPVTQRTLGEPVWTGGTSEIQLRAQTPLSEVHLQLIDVSGGAGARRQALARAPLGLAASLPTAVPLLAAGAGQPAILARRGWAQGVCPPKVAPGYGDVRMAFVHHTENPNGYSAGEVPAMLRAIYAFHRFSNGWNDIGYNFVIDLYGRIFEARAGGIDEPVVGAHAGGYNLVSSGVAVLGSFVSVPISTPARLALERLLAWKLSLHGLPSRGHVTVKVNPEGAVYSRFPANAHVPLPRIAGHRDGDSTDCPGDVLYGELDAIRSAVSQLAPRPVRATLALAAAAPSTPAAPTTPTTPGTPTAPAPPAEAVTPAPMLTGALRFLDGTPIAGATVLVQVRTVAKLGERVSERTIAQAVTDAQGRWSLWSAIAGAPAGRSWLRVLCEGASGYGAAVSPPLRVRLSAPAAAEAPVPTPPAVAPPPA